MGYNYSSVEDPKYQREIYDLDSAKWMLPRTFLNITAKIREMEFGVKNATLNYIVTKPPLPGIGQVLPAENHTALEMDLISGNRFSGTYLARIPPIQSSRDMNFYVEYTDYNKTNHVSEYGFNYINIPQSWKGGNTISSEIKALNLDMSRLTIDTEITVDGEYVNTTEITQPYNRSNVHGSINTEQLIIFRISDKPSDLYYIEEGKEGSYDLFIQDDQPFLYPHLGYLGVHKFNYSAIPLLGEPSRYPFDKYHMNLTLAIPLLNLLNPTLNFSAKYDSLVNSTWNPSLDVKEIKLDNDPVRFVNIKFDFQRNYTISIVIIPILAIFFLLGAIFIFDFEDRVDLVSSRMALTLGIFALIFTLPEIINSMKPVTSGPTIADSLLSIIVISTISFTVSSALSNSSTIRNWFPKHYSWIDGIVFLIVSGIVIAYFRDLLFDPCTILSTVWIGGLQSIAKYSCKQSIYNLSGSKHDGS